MLRRWSLASFVAVGVTLAACSDGSILSVDAGMTVRKLSGDNQSATVGSATALRPSVRITGETGQPLAGIAVAFRVSSGGGGVTGGDATTDAAGIATVGSWVLGERAGPNTLSATVGGAIPVLFAATGLAGPPASIIKLVGDSQDGDVSNPVVTLPTVAIRDAHGNPVAGAAVSFSVVLGGGELAGARAITGSQGTARVGAWTLGPAPGPNTLEAAVPGLPAATFTVIAANRCLNATPYAFGSSTEGTLRLGGCRLFSGELTDRYSVSAPSATTLRLDMRSPAFSPHVSVFDTSGALLASSPQYCGGEYCGGATSVRVLLAAGDYVLGAGGFGYDYDDSVVGGFPGPYSLSSTAVPEDIAGCSGDARVFVVPGVTTAQRVETSDCEESVVLHSSRYTVFYDRIDVDLSAGRTYTISMQSADFDTYLELWTTQPHGGWEGRVEFDDDADGSSNSRITFTPTWSGQYAIRAAAHGFGTTGSYTLSVR